MPLPEPLPTLPHGSAADAYLAVVGRKQGPLKGESETPGHVDEIAVIAWRWGVSSPTATGSSQATGRRMYDVLEIDKLVDGSSTRLLNSLGNNEDLKSATLALRKAGTGEDDYFKITLELARIVACRMQSSPSGGLYETVSIAYQKITMEYSPQQAGGAKGAGSSFTDEWYQP